MTASSRTVPAQRAPDRNAIRRRRRHIQHPRGVCTSCGGEYVIRADNTIGVHRGFGGGGNCAGVGKPPRRNFEEGGSDFSAALVHAFVQRYANMHGKRPTQLQVSDGLRRRHSDAYVREVAKQFGLIAVDRNGHRI